ncbi:retrotransposable element Tf2 [Tanacetum coccineum]
MVNTRQIVSQSSNQIDDAMKTFITDTINAALASSMESVTRYFQEQLERTITAMNSSVNGVCTRQDALAAEVHRFIGDTGTSNRNVNIRMNMIAKTEFLKFHRDDPTGWVYRCNQFFKVDDIVLEDKVKLASMYLYDKALAWHQQFTKLHGENVVWEVYVEALLKRFSMDVPEAQAISFFLGGLDKEIEMTNRMFKPQSLVDTYCLSKLQETNNSVSMKINKPLISTPRAVYNNFVRNPGSQVANVNYTPNRPKPVNNSSPYRKQLTQKELDEKRAKNQCFYYDQKYVPGHKCSGRLFSLEIVAGSGEMEEEVGEQIDEEVFGYADSAVENMVDGYNDCNNETDAGQTFQADMMLIPLGGCEMVLGVQWLATMGDIVCNFLQLRIEFVYQGRKVALRGVPQPTLQWMQGKQLGAKLFSMALCVYPFYGVQAELMSTGINSEPTNVHPSLSPLLHKYERVFVVLKLLPPHRKHDHRIPLQDNTAPINIRSYRHPPIQKDVIEAMVTELLDSGVIRESHSPFSSPIVMVKKEELIDELFGAPVFTKLDLRSGYHQIRMCEEDIHKTAFRTHQVFSKDMEEHVKHLALVLNTMQSHQLFAKIRVSTDPSKVKAMQEWPMPVNIKKLRAQQAFENLKIAMINAPVLALPNFQEEFTVETDASDEGIGAVLSPLTSLQTMVIPDISNDLLQRIRVSWESDPSIQQIINKFKDGPIAGSKFTWQNDQLMRNEKPVIGTDENLRQELLKLKVVFYWKGKNKSVREHVRVCAICQCYKPDLAPYPGLLQPLPIPTKIWTDISMDFIEGLPSSHGKSVILVIIDRLSKYGHFIPLSHPFKAAQIAQVFLDTIYKLHGLPKTITSDRDKIFISTFWKELFKRLGITLQLSTAYHPQTDGQTKVVNRILVQTNDHTSINTTPFEVVYGQTPPTHVFYMVGDSHMEAVDRTLVAREAAIVVLQFHLERAQQRMKMFADKNRSDRSFVVRDWVLLKLQPHRQVTLRMHKQHKFSPKFYGPFQVLAKYGQVAYKLLLPDNATVHDVFHVSQLKPFKGQPTTPIPLPHCNKEGLITAILVAVLDRRIAKVRNAAVVYWLVQWSNGDADDNTWEVATELQAKYPRFDADSCGQE